ncbi:hypothetical protein A3F00_02505 [Candidatus Daviesbacteria bacterium RIFCSPHIGHO2_12_FULL_37_11]|uniref:Glycosyltransferase RgtA/B/C/D-like domain-containing protein n=1 Tax=Candidatus Daviesbacteria bacterium RIFCSPHIGHO2_12_FULL_37_11 TaxID=1797777 RepID=A0A1F5K8I1_9BACT|nr:MAG: hypothetical protein A3F00_02505 [Candidatus Daviesbacteria bacterium RIFCSPHIGHO2_12_FULL_37_11]
MFYHNKVIKDTQMVFLTFFSTIFFFIFGMGTLPDYGINWDAASHLSRGQAYLYYYLTGEEDYSNFNNLKLYIEKETGIKKNITKYSVFRQRLYQQNPNTIFFSPDIPKSQIPRISVYQNTGADLQDMKDRYDFGHPHISDVLASIFNYVLFQKLGLLNDIDSYRVYSVLLSSMLVGLVFFWTASSYGKFAGIVATLSLALYPLFWSESHFNNEKDIPETVFITFMLFSFWKGITGKSWKWILTSGVFFGLALGTKFNVLFSIFVILPWLICYLISKRSKKLSPRNFFKKYAKIIIAIAAAPILGFLIVFGTWPLFWTDPLRKISRIVDFYKTIGTAANIDQGFISLFGVNTYPFQWILYTTPVVILFLVTFGIIKIFLDKFKEKKMQSLLFLLMLVIPVARVTWPGMNIYGGVRQIMEYIPPMAMLAGIGGEFLRSWICRLLIRITISKYKPIVFSSALVFVLYIPITLKLFEIHPNENVYFNPLIGGLKGASERNFPGWGVSFGAPYREAIEWINKNVEPGAKLTTGYEILSNIPAIFIRPDIDYKSNRSGYLREGEYVISLRFQGVEKRSYFDMYLDNIIEPVYQIKADGVPILKIWKNDLDHLRSGWSNEEIIDNLKYTKNGKGILFDIGKEVKLSRLEVNYDQNGCPELDSGYLMISKDRNVWERIPGVLPEEVRIKTLGIQPRDGSFIEPFAGQTARYINFFVTPVDTCVTQIERVRLYYFK